MRKTIYLPDELAAQVDDYLKQHRGETLSSLVQEALEARVVPRKRPSILDLAGIVSVDPDHAHDDFVGRPEDDTVDWYDGPPR
jgi:metal-responsive CopG/Arc/MetJ family transcriptional regulator